MKQALLSGKSLYGQRPLVDGKRKRRHSLLKAKRDWYAHHRATRFARHLGFHYDHV